MQQISKRGSPLLLYVGIPTYVPVASETTQKAVELRGPDLKDGLWTLSSFNFVVIFLATSEVRRACSFMFLFLFNNNVIENAGAEHVAQRCLELGAEE